MSDIMTSSPPLHGSYRASAWCYGCAVLGQWIPRMRCFASKAHVVPLIANTTPAYWTTRRNPSHLHLESGTSFPVLDPINRYCSSCHPAAIKSAIGMPMLECARSSKPLCSKTRAHASQLVRLKCPGFTGCLRASLIPPNLSLIAFYFPHDIPLLALLFFCTIGIGVLEQVCRTLDCRMA